MIPTLLSSLLERPPYALLAILLTTIVLASYIHSYRRLAHFPGPRLASFSYLWMLRTSLSGRQSYRYMHLHDTYSSPLVRIGPNDLITNDPTLIKRMSAARSPYRRSTWYRTMKMDPYADSLFSLPDNTAHDKLKAKMSFGYGGREVPDLEAGIDEQLVAMVDLLRRKYSTVGDELVKADLVNVINFFTLDVLTRIAYGRAFGYLERDEDVFSYIKTAEEAVPALTLMAEVPALGRIFMHPWMLKLMGPKKTDPAGIGKLLSVADEVVAERFRPEAEDQHDMLGSFVRHGVSQQDCVTEVPFQIIAGADTTASAIRATVLHLMSTPHAYHRLQKEIDAAIRAGKLSSPVKADEAKHLEYLQAVIYEGLRIKSPFTGLVMKEVPPEGENFNGLFIPGGTRIAHNTMSVTRSKSIFGQDADLFRPERWLGVSAEKKAEMVSTTELVFGYGRWGCAGKPVAFLELNKVYVELFRHFDFQVVNPAQPWQEKNHNFFFHHDMLAKVTERKVKV